MRIFSLSTFAVLNSISSVDGWDPCTSSDDRITSPFVGFAADIAGRRPMFLAAPFTNLTDDSEDGHGMDATKSLDACYRQCERLSSLSFSALTSHLRQRASERRRNDGVNVPFTVHAHDASQRTRRLTFRCVWQRCSARPATVNSVDTYLGGRDGQGARLRLLTFLGADRRLAALESSRGSRRTSTTSWSNDPMREHNVNKQRRPRQSETDSPSTTTTTTTTTTATSAQSPRRREEMTARREKMGTRGRRENAAVS